MEDWGQRPCGAGGQARDEGADVMGKGEMVEIGCDGIVGSPASRRAIGSVEG